MVKTLREILEENGISVSPIEGCPFATVAVDKSEGGLKIHIEDAHGRKAARTMLEYESVAWAIESWIRSDLNQHMLSPPSVSASPMVTDEEVPWTRDEGDFTATPQPEETLGYIDLGADFGVGFDGSTWFGGSLSGCVDTGPVCPGVSVKLAADPGLSGDSKKLESERKLLDLTGMLDVPIELDRFVLRPGLNVGAAMVRTSRSIDYYYDETEEPREKDRKSQIVYSDRSWEFSVGGHFIGALALGRGFSLTLGVSVAVLPMADVTTGVVDEKVSLPGIPRGIARGTLGLEYAI